MVTGKCLTTASLPNHNVYAFLRSVAQDVQLLSVQDTCNYNRRLRGKAHDLQRLGIGIDILKMAAIRFVIENVTTQLERVNH